MIERARIVAQGFYTPSGEPRLEPAPPEPVAASLSLLPRQLRRGLSPLTRSVLAAVEQAVGGIEPGVPLPAVFASRYGELQTAVELMRRASHENASSPARFRHSVQNTVVGLLSVARADPAPSTALASGPSTLAMGLLEAFALLGDGHPRVLFALGEEPVPEVFGRVDLGGGAAVAWVLAVDHGEGPWLARPSRVPGAAGPGADSQPIALALELARSVRALGETADSGAGRSVQLGAAPHGRWQALLSRV